MRLSKILMVLFAFFVFGLSSAAADRALVGFGDNSYGRLGDGTTNDRYSPVQVSNLTDVASSSAGREHTCAVKNDGTVWCWGRNIYGELGDGSTTNHPIPVQVSSLTDAVSVSAGYWHTCAVKNDGTVWCWGYNRYGQLGDRSVTERHTPVQASSLTDVVSVSAGGYHTCALKNDGTVWCWGYNNHGQLGDGTTAKSTTPVQVMTDAVSVSAGDSHTCALKNDGTVWCWGYNRYGRLGDGSTTSRHTPVQVSSLTDAVSVSAGGEHTCALKNDGTVWCWGRNNRGQLGDGSTTNHPTPVQVSNLTDVVSVSAGYEHTFSLKNDGTVWCWGSNVYGRLGDGTGADQHTPVQVSNLTDAVSVSAGYAHTMVLGTLHLDPPSITLPSTIYSHMPFTIVGSSSENVSLWSWKIYDSDSNLVYSDNSSSQTTLTLDSPGQYTVTLQIQNDSGVTGDNSEAFSVGNPSPVAVINGPDSSSAGDQVCFDGNASSDINGGIASYSWTASGPESYSGAESTFCFVPSSSGNYTIALVVTDLDGAQNQVQKQLSVIARPSISLPSTIYSHMPFAIVGSSSENVSLWSWKIYDSDSNLVYSDNSSNETTPTLDSPGQYTVTLQIQTNSGGTSNSSEAFNVGNPSPVAVINGPDSSSAGDQVCFDGNASSDINGGIASYSWTASGPESYSGAESTFCFTPSSSGNYTIALVVTDLDGAQDQVQKALEVGASSDHTVLLVKPGDHIMDSDNSTVTVGQPITRVALEKCHPAFYLNTECASLGLDDVCTGDPRDLICNGASNSRRIGCIGNDSVNIDNINVFFDAASCQGEGLVSCDLKVYNNQALVAERHLTGQCKGYGWLDQDPQDTVPNAFSVPSAVYRQPNGTYRIPYTCHGTCEPQLIVSGNFQTIAACDETITDALCTYVIKPVSSSYPKVVQATGPGNPSIKDIYLLDKPSVSIDIGRVGCAIENSDLRTSPGVIVNGSSGVASARLYGKDANVTSIDAEGTGLTITSSYLGHIKNSFAEAQGDVSCSSETCIAYFVFHGVSYGQPFTKRVPVLSGSAIPSLGTTLFRMDQSPFFKFKNVGLAKIEFKNASNHPITVTGYRKVLPTGFALLWTDLMGEIPAGETREAFLLNSEPTSKLGYITFYGYNGTSVGCDSNKIRKLFRVTLSENAPDICNSSNKRDYDASPLVEISVLGNKIDTVPTGSIVQRLGTRHPALMDYQDLLAEIQSIEESSKDIDRGMVILMSDGSTEEICK